MQIFVLGTGRSGTHWIGNLLASHPDVNATIESRGVFQVATQAAIRSRSRRYLLPVLRAFYAVQSRRARPQHYADKSHPVIWYAETLGDWFPEARFVAVERSPFGTVASMLRHSGVSRWQVDWRRYGVPNRFLGIDEENASAYDDMTPAEQAALRWKSHHERLAELRECLGSRLHVVRYEALTDDYHSELEDLWEFLSLPNIDVPEHRPTSSSRDAWRGHLTAQQCREISTVTGVEVPR